MNLIPVEGERNLARDTSSNAIINVSEQEYHAYMARKSINDSEKQRVEKIENEIADIKDNLNEIKSLLRSLANGS